MDSRQRIAVALSCGVPDRVPILEAFDDVSIIRLVGLLTPSKVKGLPADAGIEGPETQITELYLHLIEKLGLDATFSGVSTGLQRINDRTAVDRFGTRYLLSAHGGPLPVDGPVKCFRDARGLDMASKLDSDDLGSLARVVETFGEDKAHFVSVTDPFKASWRLTGGMQKLLVFFWTDPPLVHHLARATTDFSLAAIDLGLEGGGDVIFLGGDLAGETSLFISPEHYREFIKPYHTEIVEHTHRKGGKIVKHTDGNIWPILDDLLESGFDGIHPFQPQCMDISEVKKRLAGEACVLGNIDCRSLLPFGTEGEVQTTVRETLRRVAPGGGYIISSSNSIHPGCRPENYLAMVEAAHAYGTYQ